MKRRDIVFSKFDGRCAYCGCKLEKGWHVDKMNPKNDDNIDNFMPACPSCNRTKNKFTLENFRKTINGFVKSLNSYHSQYQFAKKFGLVEETNKEVMFYFETLGDRNEKL